MWAQSRKREGEQQKAIRKEVGEEDGMVGHERYNNLARSLNKSYSSGNIVSG